MSAGPQWARLGPGWPNRAASRFVACGPLHWHVQIMGREDVLLLLHGTGAATHSWRDLAPLLATRFRVVAPDLPGHGFTTGRLPGRRAMPAMAQALGDLLRKLDLDPHVIVGHSAGAAIAIRMVLDGLAKPGALVGIGAALLPIPGLAGALFPQLARLLFVNPLAPHLFAQMARTRGETGRFLARSTGSKLDPAAIAAYESLFATPGHCAGAITMMADWDLPALRRDLPRLTTPVLLIHGERDAAIPLADARRAAGLIPGAHLISLGGLGHLAHEENPAEIATRITAFVQEVCA
jgi:magnesium chelatase accessory protein